MKKWRSLFYPLRSIFSHWTLGPLDLADLENEFYKKLPGIRDRIYEKLIKRKFYAARPDDVKKDYLLAAGITFGVFFFLFVTRLGTDFLGQTQLSFILAAALSALSVAFFGWFMPTRTPLGASNLGAGTGI